MKNVVALVNLHNSTDLGILTNSRPLASTTFLGRYTFIDFVLSNLTNSGIDKVGILIKNHSRSIIKHIKSDSTYLNNSKTGYQSLFINEKGLTNPSFNTDVNNIRENDWFLYDDYCKYVVIAPVQFVTKIDFSEIVKEHIESRKLVSVVYKHTNEAKKRFIHCDKITVDALNNIQKFTVNNGEQDDAYISLETYVFNRDFLKEILDKIDTISSMFTLKDIIHFLSMSHEKINAIEHKGFVREFASFKDYFKSSLELLDTENINEILFKEDWKFYTTSHNSRPILYGINSDVSASILANGSTIDGKVEHSILSRNVTVEEGATVKNCIIFTDCVIKSGVHLENCIVDKYCIIKNKKDIIGDKDNPIYIPQGAHI